MFVDRGVVAFELGIPRVGRHVILFWRWWYWTRRAPARGLESAMERRKIQDRGKQESQSRFKKRRDSF